MEYKNDWNISYRKLYVNNDSNGKTEIKEIENIFFYHCLVYFCLP